jgi:hypothetical protein
MNTEGLIYNRDNVAKSLDILAETNKELQATQMQIQNALNVLRNVRGKEKIKQLENVFGNVNPNEFADNCNESLMDAITRMQKSVTSIEDYLYNGGSYPTIEPSTNPHLPTTPTTTP